MRKQRLSVCVARQVTTPRSVAWSVGTAAIRTTTADVILESATFTHHLRSGGLSGVAEHALTIIFVARAIWPPAAVAGARTRTRARARAALLRSAVRMTIRVLIT